MIDIICFPGKHLELGFEKVYQLSELRAVAATREEILKNALQSRKIDFVYNLEKNAKNDKMNRRASGLNQVYCKIMHDKGVAVAFNFNLVLNAEDEGLILGRMMQNVKFCRKYKVRMIIASFANNPYEQRAADDLTAFGRSIGMTGKEANDALNFSKEAFIQHR